MPRLVEVRDAGAHCTGTGGDRGLLQRSVDAVADCVAVVAARIGPCARRELDAAGVLALEHAGPGLDGLGPGIEALRRSPVLRARQESRRERRQTSRQEARHDAGRRARQEVRTR